MQHEHPFSPLAATVKALGTFREDSAAPARQPRGNVARRTGADAWRSDSSGGFVPRTEGWQRKDGVMFFQSPEAMMEYWRCLSDSQQVTEAQRTARLMRRLLMRPSRLEFPHVPVLLDSQRLKGAMVDDAFLYLRVERMSRARAGALEGFDPLAFLAHALNNVVAQIWKADPMRASRWPVSERRWQQNLESDESEDIRLLGISFRTLAAPLLLTSDMA
ncbi:hypothetical protein [Neoroseomonas lacus]|uniref:Uncharacterized protein n=1 Tax=Neoroseomonas lacus TaxID=287609 RepID=A0A917NRM4_9PROT|nr:hypothetical protein [Neoroseomonas lacus]GGJ21894.1 hypothetical protein GCM10011320_31400 [Neoroseomonas lacus]